MGSNDSAGDSDEKDDPAKATADEAEEKAASAATEEDEAAEALSTANPPASTDRLEPAEAAKKPSDPAPPPAHGAPAPVGAAWAEPLARFEKRWTAAESRLLTFVLLSELVALTSWVALNGLSEPITKADGGTAGLVFRGAVGAIGLGLAAHFGLKKQGAGTRRGATLAAIVVGIVIAPLWRATGVDYFDNVKGWLQEGSTLTLMGGLRGVATRLTLWLALLGGSLATGAGKHIHIDVVFRFLPKRLRLPAALLNYVGAACVCFAAVWGFFDHIAIESYGSKADDSAGDKIAHSLHEIGDHFFLTRKQVGLDLRTLPHVLGGERYDKWMTGAAWNAWVDDAGFDDRFPKQKVASVRVPDGTATHTPLVVSPSGMVTRGMLVHTLGLVIPFGLLAIGLRFLLRALLSLSGHIAVDPDEAHKEDLRGAEGGS